MSDGREFDPLSQSAADLEDAEMSGMGSKLIRKLTDNASYNRSNDNNVITLAFRLGASFAAAA
jgi:anti-sigma regulatory factor (Ser/Thr protein kinase)